MACRPAWQLFDGSRPDRTNRYVFTANEGGVTTVTANGLAEGDRVLLLVEDETGEFVPYLDSNGQQVYLDADNPTALVEPGTYRIDTSEIADTEGVTVSSTTKPDTIVSSSVACFTPTGGNPTAVEIVRFRGVSEPAVYKLGTDERIIVTAGEFAESCGDPNPDPEFDPVPEFLSLEARNGNFMLHGTGNRADGFKIAAADGVELGISIRYDSEAGIEDSVPEQTGSYNVGTPSTPDDWRFAFSAKVLESLEYYNLLLEVSTDRINPDLSTGSLAWSYDHATNTWVGEISAGSPTAPGSFDDSTATANVVQNIQSFGFDFIREHLTPEIAEAPVTGSFIIRLTAQSIAPDAIPLQLTVPFSVSGAL